MSQELGNPYYPIYKDSKGQVQQSPTPAPMPSSRSVDLQQQQIAVNAAKAQDAARKARQGFPNVKYTKKGK